MMAFVEMDEANKRIREIKNRAEKAETRMCELENLIQWCSVCGYSNDLGRGLCRQCLNRLGSPSVGTEKTDLETSADHAHTRARAPDVDDGTTPDRENRTEASTRHSPPAEAQESRGATCKARAWLEVDESMPTGEPCGKPAKWLSCSPIIDQPVCDEHRCRCRKPIDQRPAEPLMPSKSGMLWAPYEIDMLARAVRRAHEALNIDMGDGEPTYQCCNAVCGHCNCVVGDAVRLLEKRSADPLRTSEAKPCEACENAKSDPMALYFCEEHGTNVPPGLNMPEATRPRSNEAAAILSHLEWILANRTWLNTAELIREQLSTIAAAPCTNEASPETALNKLICLSCGKDASKNILDGVYVGNLVEIHRRLVAGLQAENRKLGERIANQRKKIRELEAARTDNPRNDSLDEASFDGHRVTVDGFLLKELLHCADAYKGLEVARIAAKVRADAKDARSEDGRSIGGCEPHSRMRAELERLRQAAVVAEAAAQVTDAKIAKLEKQCAETPKNDRWNEAIERAAREAENTQPTMIGTGGTGGTPTEIHYQPNPYAATCAANIRRLKNTPEGGDR